MIRRAAGPPPRPALLCLPDFRQMWCEAQGSASVPPVHLRAKQCNQRNQCKQDKQCNQRKQGKRGK